MPQSPYPAPFRLALEYMIVDLNHLQLLPLADRLLQVVARQDRAQTVQRGNILWLSGPHRNTIRLQNKSWSQKFAPASDSFQREISYINKVLEPMGGMLLPTSMHPWITHDPEASNWSPCCPEAQLSLLCTDQQELQRLFQAARIVLPLLPALSASSPLSEGKPTGHKCSRLLSPKPHKASNGIPADIAAAPAQKQLPSPLTLAANQQQLTLHIGLLDVQESPLADICIASLICYLLQALQSGQWETLEHICAFPAETLESILAKSIIHGEEALIDQRTYLEFFGHRGASCSAQELLGAIMDELVPPTSNFYEPAGFIIGEGSLATRILRSSGPETSRINIHNTYQDLGQCLAQGTLFHG
ncbi:hypothetical protein HNR37_001104 [Desulfurispira natronophila]|uniref:Uncharacterized protein n=2 Tax=Desulfurispira natronophila TaxID=682562 RepID=A0A7W7Y467_9BACT|nr:hypothetical protein [Desulfurispira natronophila]